MTNIRLKRCPCCHSIARLRIDWDSQRVNGCYGQYVICTNCPARTQTESDPYQAIEEWNHRMIKRSIQLTLF